MRETRRLDEVDGKSDGERDKGPHEADEKDYPERTLSELFVPRE